MQIGRICRRFFCFFKGESVPDPLRPGWVLHRETAKRQSPPRPGGLRSEATALALVTSDGSRRPGATRPCRLSRVPPATPQPTPSPAGSRRSCLGVAQAHSAPAPPTWLRWCRFSCSGRGGEDAEPLGSHCRRRSRGGEA